MLYNFSVIKNITGLPVYIAVLSRDYYHCVFRVYLPEDYLYKDVNNNTKKITMIAPIRTTKEILIWFDNDFDNAITITYELSNNKVLQEDIVFLPSHKTKGYLICVRKELEFAPIETVEL